MRLVSSALLTLLLLSGCTGGDETSASDDATTSTAIPTDQESLDTETGDNPAPGSTEDVPDGPDCRDIWKSGATLPKDFTVCVLDGRVPELDVTECQDGSKLIVADNIMWGRTGEGKIVRAKESPLQDSDAYGTDYADCTGR